MKCCWYTMGTNRSNCFEVFEERGCRLEQVQAENVDHRNHRNQQRRRWSQRESQPCWPSQASTLKAEKEGHRNLLSLQARQTRARRDENHDIGSGDGSWQVFWWELLGFPGGSDSKESACNAGDLGLILRSGRSPGEGNGYPLQDSCLENSKDRGAWRATVCGVRKSQTQLSH